MCRLNMQAAVSETGDKFNVELSIRGKIPEGEISIMPFRRNVPRPLEAHMEFKELDILQLSEFYTLRAEAEGISLERIIKIPTEGIPQERESAVLNSVVKDRRSFIEYVAFVLGDDYLQSYLESESLESSGFWQQAHKQLPALYEKMLRTALDDSQKLNDIGYLLSMITDENIVPEEFRSLYETFRKTLKLK